MRKGNIMARERMIVLYDQSAAFHGLVVGTGNKTEILLGYTTLYGDFGLRASTRSATCTRPRCASFRARVGVPEAIIAQAALRRPVDRADRRRRAGLHLRRGGPAALPAGRPALHARRSAWRPALPRAFVRAVVERVRRNQFKRVLPPIAKLSNRTIGYDFLYLRDWGT